MSFLSRVAALGRGTIDRVLTQAELAAGLRPPVRPLEPALISDAPEVPFFPDDTDWRQVGENLSKAAAIPVAIEALRGPTDGPARAPKALIHDPFQMVELLGWKERPTGLAYTIQEQIVKRTPVIQAMILVRLSQAARHCQIQSDSHAIGFRVRHRDKKKNLTRAARALAAEMETALMKTTRGDAGVGRPMFSDFTKAVLRNSLTFDQANFEVIHNRRGKPYSWHAVDAKTIRFADTAERFLDRKSDNAIRTVQILDGQVINEWPANQLAFLIRNPDSSIQSQGYGTSELEMLMHVVTAILWAYQYNQRFFSQGATPKGVLNFKGQVPGRQLAAFRRFFYQMISGVENAWKTPVLNAEQGVEWVSMHSTNRDMEYSAWMDFLIKLAAAMYLMDPTEIGFKYGNEGDRSMFESANEQKVTQSKDKGLKPILSWWGDGINRYIIQPWDEDFELQYLGLDSLTPKEQADLDEVRTRTYMMIDEVRAAEGLDPMPDGTGQVINSASWLQYLAQKQAPQPESGEDASPGDDQSGSQGLEDLFATMGGSSGGPEVRKSFTALEL